MSLTNFFVYPRYPDNLKRLFTLAYNLWCSWNYEAVNLFYRIDAQRFRAVHHNPVQLLLSLPAERIEALSRDDGFLFEMNKVYEKFEQYINYRQATDNYQDGLGKDDIIAYFSMEFGLHECIPIYGGGLGILAGDFLKAASDLGMPFVGIGLIYKYGYFTQRIHLDGLQEELFIEFDNHLVPMRECRDAEGQRLYIEMTILGRPLKIKLWQIDVGQTRLILLDTDIKENPKDLRDITHELYVSDREKRLQQEWLLGLGGVKALQALGVRPKVYHINEGHSAFLVIARLQELMRDGLSWSEAKAVIRASTVFTTHTPVIAGNENFKMELVKKYMETDVKALGLTFEELAADGFVDSDKNVFWLPAFAIRYARYINGVSALHGQVSRRMWASLFPKTRMIELPIGYITNGVHSSWVSEPFTELLNRHLGPDYIHHACGKELWDKILTIPDDQIWEAHHKNKQILATFIRGKLMDDLGERGYIPSKGFKLSRFFNPEYLTIVFARRFAPYKRPTLLLKDKERLKRILSNPDKPIQLIFAGKAHPADSLGKKLIQEILEYAREYELEERVVFLENYDINVARHLAWGADVWLNTPIREMEASGTSGMKAAINGVLNMSVLDGWWPEVYNSENGWAITAGEYYKHSELKEAAEASQIYDLLEDEVTDLYYRSNEAGIPDKWVAMMKHSISSSSCFVSMNRVLMEYQGKYYQPAIRATAALWDNNRTALQEAAIDQVRILKYWDRITMREFHTDADVRDHLVESETLQVHCTVDLAGAASELFRVELFYQFAGQYVIIPMRLVEQNGNIARYEGRFEIQGYGKQNINARLRPANDVTCDLHPEWILWAR